MDHLTLKPTVMIDTQKEEITDWEGELELYSVDPVHPLNMEILNDIKDVLDDEFADFIKGYVGRSITTVEDIKKAIEGKDYETIKDHAHPLKGASAQMGACIVSSICVRLEMLASPENHDYIVSLFVILEHENNEANNLLMDLVKN